MFDRFTSHARKVMGIAREEAWRLRHGHIGTEHVLLALVQADPGLTMKLFNELDLDLGKLREGVEKVAPPGGATSRERQLPFTPRAKNAFEFAMEEASMLGNSYVSNEHLLLGLLRETEGTAAKVLVNLGLDLEALHADLLEVLGAEGYNLPRLERERARLQGYVSVLYEGRDIAVELAGDRIEAAHLLLAILLVPETPASELLRMLQVNPLAMAEELARLVDRRSPRERELSEEIARLDTWTRESRDSNRSLEAAALRERAKRLRAELEQSRIARAPKTGTVLGPFPLASDAQLAIEWAIQEAFDLRDPTLGSPCILLGLLHLTEGPAAEALRAAGVTLDRAREALRGR